MKRKRTHRGFSIYARVTRIETYLQHHNSPVDPGKVKHVAAEVRLQMSSEARRTPRCWIFQKGSLIQDNPQAAIEEAHVGFALDPRGAAKLRDGLDAYLRDVGYEK